MYEGSNEAAGAAPRDDKAAVRGELDLGSAEWTRAGGPDDADVYEFAFVEYGGVTYTVMRTTSPNEPAGKVLVYTPDEWDAFVEAAKAGEFDHPW